MTIATRGELVSQYLPSTLTNHELFVCAYFVHVRKNERFWAEPRRGVRSAQPNIRSAQPNTRLCRMHTATPGHSLQPLLSYSKVSETMGPLVLLLLNYKSVPISDEFFFGQLTELAPDQARGRQASDLSILFLQHAFFGRIHGVQQHFYSSPRKKKAVLKFRGVAICPLESCHSDGHSWGAMLSMSLF